MDGATTTANASPTKKISLALVPKATAILKLSQMMKL
jgi:hypothetical protein